MRGYTWQPAKPKPPPRPKVPEEVWQAVEPRAAAVAAKLKKRIRKPPNGTMLNWGEDLLIRWHRDALYFVVVMRTPHGRPPTFETHAARMEYAGNGKFNLAVPMRRGWNTFMRRKSPEECLKEVGRSVSF